MGTGDPLWDPAGLLESEVSGDEGLLSRPAVGLGSDTAASVGDRDVMGDVEREEPVEDGNGSGGF